MVINLVLKKHIIKNICTCTIPYGYHMTTSPYMDMRSYHVYQSSDVITAISITRDGDTGVPSVVLLVQVDITDSK